VGASTRVRICAEFFSAFLLLQLIVFYRRQLVLDVDAVNKRSGRVKKVLGEDGWDGE